MALFKYVVLVHSDVPRAAQFYAQGLGLSVTVCSQRWAELQSGAQKLGIVHGTPSSVEMKPKDYSQYLWFNVTDMDFTVRKLLSMGAELDGPIKYPADGKVAAIRYLDGHMLGLFEAAMDDPVAKT